MMSNQKNPVTVNDFSAWRQYLDELPIWRSIEPLDPDHVALVVVDAQYCCAARRSVNGAFLRDHFPRAFGTFFDRVESVVVPTILSLIANFRARNRQIIYLTASSHLPDGRDFHPLWRLREEQFQSEFGTKSYLTERDGREAQILEELAPQQGDLVLNKVSLSAFNSTGFDQILRNMGLNSLVFTGVVTNACVYATALDAADRGYRVALIEDGCATVSEPIHYAALMTFHYTFGRVLTAAEVMAELQAGDRGARPEEVSVASRGGSGKGTA